MAIVVGNTGRLLDCDSFLANDAGSWRVKLFQNNYTPVPGSVSGNFTDPTYTGYASQAIGAWGSASIDGSGNATAAGAPNLTFQPTALTSLPQTIYGWWVDDGSGNFLFGDVLPAPFTMVDTNSILILVPSFSVGELV